jgi:hypothetical protein
MLDIVRGVVAVGGFATAGEGSIGGYSPISE